MGGTKRRWYEKTGYPQGRVICMFQRNSKKSIETTAKVIVSNCKVKYTNKIDAIYVAFS